MKVSYVKVEEAVGMVIPHDITRIERGVYKGPAFRKGHVIEAEDIPVLLRLGKRNIYSLVLEEGDVHEDEAGRRIALAAAGRGITLEGPVEGRLDFTAAYSGLLKVEVEGLRELNSLPDVIVAARHTNTPVEAGEKLVGTRVIPLVVSEETVQRAEDICRRHGSVVEVVPFERYRLGVLITGSEVFEGRVEDAFGGVIKAKARSFNLSDPEILYAPDDAEVIARRIKDLLAHGAGIVIVTGGMSVDPDDVTPRGIRLSGAAVEKYGAPVLPGAMFLLAYHGNIPVVGLPACAAFFQATVFDLIFPRLLAGERVSAAEIVELGHGGLCLSCDECRFPRCPFGKGGI